MIETSVRARKTDATRARIAEAALDLFVSQGYGDTTIDQIAESAGVGRRTVFRHFTTKQAMLFDHLAVRRDFAVQQLQERPPFEPAIVSLHAVLREMCVQGYDHKLLEQIRTVLTIDRRLAAEELTLGVRAFEQNLVISLRHRSGNLHSDLQLQALTEMAERWFLTSIRAYFKHGDRSLVEYFDEVVGMCVRSCADDLSGALNVHAAIGPYLPS
jgi:AcrR family transcriptional regulator